MSACGQWDPKVLGDAAKIFRNEDRIYKVYYQGGALWLRYDYDKKEICAFETFDDAFKMRRKKKGIDQYLLYLYAEDPVIRMETHVLKWKNNS